EGTNEQSPHSTSNDLGFYVSDQVRIIQRWHLTVGTRYDRQKANGFDPFNPLTSRAGQNVHATTSQVGLVFDLTKSLALYGSWSQSFVPNSVTAVDLTGKGGFAPETGRQYEAGLKFENASQTLFATAAAYQITRANVLVA